MRKLRMTMEHYISGRGGAWTSYSVFKTIGTFKFLLSYGEESNDKNNIPLVSTRYELIG
jgi:hypothetical protein